MIPFRSIRVGPFDVGLATLDGEERDKCLGTFSEVQLTISMREKFPSKQQEAETLLHELLHAIYAIMGVRAKDPEERIINQMSIGMASVIRDNPKLIQWLVGQLQ